MVCGFQSALLPHLEPGAECADFLSRFERPHAALTWSIADPAALVAALSVDQARAPEAMGGLPPELLTQNAGGLLVYPNAFGMPIDHVIFTKVNDAEKMRSLLEAKVADGKGNLMNVSSYTFLAEPDRKSVRGIIDGYVVSGSLERIRPVIDNPRPHWEPVIGRTDVFAAELLIKPITQALAGLDHNERTAHVVNAIADNLRVSLRVSRRGEGLQIDVDFTDVMKTLIVCAAKASKRDAAAIGSPGARK
jgi:hypothetical protein